MDDIHRRRLQRLAQEMASTIDVAHRAFDDRYFVDDGHERASAAVTDAVAAIDRCVDACQKERAAMSLMEGRLDVWRIMAARANDTNLSCYQCHEILPAAELRGALNRYGDEVLLCAGCYGPEHEARRRWQR